MTISHRQPSDEHTAGPQSVKPGKVTRMACCCKLSDLLPIVRQHLVAPKNSSSANTGEAEAA